MKPAGSRLLICIAFMLTGLCARPQAKKILVNTPNQLIELSGTPGTCVMTNIPDFCPLPTDERIFSSALYKDTLYFISSLSNKLYRVKPGVPNSCALIFTFPRTDFSNIATSINNLTVDKNGILYAIDWNNGDLYLYNPYTNNLKIAGRVPFSPAGDLVFYGDKLLLSTMSGGIAEIDIANPAASTVYMSAGSYMFFGLISFPHECNKNKVYGMTPGVGGTLLVELDLENKTIIGVACTLPIIVYDGASMVETGNTIGIRVDSILIDAPCNPNELTGGARIRGYSATLGDLTYTLDNTISNNTGNFSGLAPGNHTVRITNSIGCIKDTFFTITHGLSPNIAITTTDPQSCDLQDGVIAIQAASAYQPITVSVNNGTPGTNLTLNGLPAGLYNITLRDQGNCRRDTSVTLNYLNRPAFLGPVQALATFCESRSGSIQVGVQGSTTGITASLNNGAPQTSLQFGQLDAGVYVLSVHNTGHCRFDTVIQIDKLTDPAPAISIVQRDQLCFDNNGTVTIAATGAGAPFDYSVNHSAFTPTTTYQQLAPGDYPITIRNKNLCLYDTAVTILAYPKIPVQYNVTKTEPNCKELNSGQIIVNVNGNEGPYRLQWSGRTYNNGEVIYAAPGEHVIPILNKDGCAVDSAQVALNVIIEPECDRVSVPNAFSPNNDRYNEVFRAIHGPYIKNVVLTVYNRWGQVVFRSAAGKAGWDGTLNGQLCPQGTYVWTLTYSNYAGVKKKLNGVVLLTR